MTRRSLLGALGAAGLASILGGCDENKEGAMQLPDPLSPIPTKKLAIADNGYAPPPGYAAPPASQPLPPPLAPRPAPASANTLSPDALDILPRSAWAREGPNMKTIDPMNGVRLITFHHSGDPKPFLADDYATTAVHLESVRAYHRSRSFQDIGYHFAIDRMGRVWALRSTAYQGQHVRYNNEHNLGIVVLGNFDLQAMTQAQKDRVRSFGTQVRKQHNLAATRIYTHKEIVSTECPGDNMQPYMVDIRRRGLI